LIIRGNGYLEGGRGGLSGKLQWVMIFKLVVKYTFEDGFEEYMELEL